MNPRNPSAICYHVVERTEIEKILKKAKVLNRKRESDNLFSPGMLDLLYFRLSKLTEWSEISASTSSRKTKGEILHMNTIQTRNANEKLQPMLRQPKKEATTLLKCSQKCSSTKRPGWDHIHCCLLYTIKWTMFSVSKFCGGINVSNTIVGISLVIVFFILVIIALRFWNHLANILERCRCKSSSKYKSAKVQPISKVRGESPRDVIRWWKEDEGKRQIDFNQHHSVHDAAKVSLRKGKSCEVEAEMSDDDKAIWNDYARKHFEEALELLDILPLEKSFSSLCFVKDRLATLSLHVQSKEVQYLVIQKINFYQMLNCG